jgi:hypothetical protein
MEFINMQAVVWCVAEFHDYCGKKLETRQLHISIDGYDNPNYTVNFCPKCGAYMYYHGEAGREGIESENPHDVESYINNLILEGKKALVPAAPRIF